MNQKLTATSKSSQTYKNSLNPEKEALEKVYTFILAHNKIAAEYEKQKLISKGGN